MDLIEVLFGDFTHVPDQVRREAVARIEAALNSSSVSSSGSSLRWASMKACSSGVMSCFERNGLVFGSVLIVAKNGLNLVGGDVQAGCDQRQVRFEILLADRAGDSN